MVARKPGERTVEPGGNAAAGSRILIIEARFYGELADALAGGAVAAIEAAGATYERIGVPGALEIPQALKLACRIGGLGPPDGHTRFQAAIGLGCVIRGETTHYDTVCDMSNHWLMHVANEHGVAVGNAILTVENESQAWARANGGIDNKGGDAARAALRLVAIARAMARGPGHG